MSDIDKEANALVVAFFGVLIGLPLFSLFVSAALVHSWWLAPPIGVGIIVAGVHKGRKDDAQKAELQRNAEANRRKVIEAGEAARQTQLRLEALDEQRRQLVHDLEVSRQRAIESAEAARDAEFRAEVAREAHRQVQEIIDRNALAEMGFADPAHARVGSDRLPPADLAAATEIAEAEALAAEARARAIRLRHEWEADLDPEAVIRRLTNPN
ncbi:MAG TPA: hypothetical protein VF299_03335 [Mycobacterium sp.]